ncbi:MAG: hypothetical protein KatS3mg110_2243 [Pirellulaceae bacterium]|nr:MAG: hypothetical protein KatS3mg110_2243 [Pirellulaceae bacterium]
MEVLPVWDDEQLLWAVPLDDGNAFRLVRIFVQEDKGQWPAHLAQWLARSPTGILWAVANYLESEQHWPAGILPLAEWLCRWIAHGEGSRWERDTEWFAGELPTFSENDRRQWGQTVAVMLQAARSVAQGNLPCAQSLSFWTLVACGLEQWLLPVPAVTERSFSYAQLLRWQQQIRPSTASMSAADRPAPQGTFAVGGPNQNGAMAQLPYDGLAAAVGAALENAESGEVEDASHVAAWLATDPRPSSWLVEALPRLACWRSLDENFQQQLQRAKLAALKEFAYGASHELNNPLANISMRAEALLREETHPERRRKLATILSQAMRAHEMIADLMLFAKPPAPQKKRVPAGQVIRRAVERLLNRAEEQGTQLRLSVPDEPLYVEADEQQLAAAVEAVCVNALEAVASGGLVQVELATCGGPGQPAGWVQIAVRDSGPGVPQGAISHVFDPFFSGREAGRGLGLGLSKCWRIMEQHGGQVSLESSPAGVTVYLRLPLSEPPASRNSGS